MNFSVEDSQHDFIPGTPIILATHIGNQFAPKLPSIREHTNFTGGNIENRQLIISKMML